MMAENKKWSYWKNIEEKRVLKEWVSYDLGCRWNTILYAN